MSNANAVTTYNARLFGGGIYGFHHLRRFHWLQRQVKAFAVGRPDISILELGCYDARTLDWIPVPVRRYTGVDAGWNSGVVAGEVCGIEAARRRFAGNSAYRFIESTDPGDVAALDEVFDVGICMETFEHVEPAQLEDYIAAFAGKVRGLMLVTVPNEKGFPLLCKALGSLVLRKERAAPYSAGELANAVLGRMERVPRCHHKGFNYSAVQALLGRYFGQVECAGISPAAAPPGLSLTLGMVARHQEIAV